MEFSKFFDAIKNLSRIIHNLQKLNHKTIVKMFDDIPWRKYGGAVMWILPAVSAGDHRGRTSFFANRPYQNEMIAVSVFNSLSKFKASDYKPVEELKTMKPQMIKDFTYRTKIAIVTAQMKGF